MGWTPPEDPDPHKILHEGVQDAKDGRHDVALAKFQWFHDYSLEYDETLSAVRLSFALGYWWDLAQRYSPAMEALLRTRDRADETFQKLRDWESFHVLTALNRRLGEAAKTADLFAEIADADMELAQTLYSVAQRELIALERHGECEPFLNPNDDLERLIKGYYDKKKIAGYLPPPHSEDVDFADLARGDFVRDATTLVALLVRNDRLDEAEQTRVCALAVLDDEEFRAMLAEALSGQFPGS